MSATQPALANSSAPESTRGRSRWVLLALLLAITIVNFVDRQTLSVLAPKIREAFQLSHTAYGWIVAAFQFGMMTGELPMGWVMDRWGVRLGLSLAVLSWSVATGFQSLARNGLALGAMRFWMGTGECGNYSGGVKAVNRWFRKSERALAIGIFNAGSMIGSTIAPPFIVYLAMHYGYRWAFLLPALLGIGWVLVWRAVYKEKREAVTPQTELATSVARLLGARQTWAIMACRFLVGPIAQLYWYWMPDYLYTARGLSLHDIGALSWIPFILGDIGSVSGGWAAGYLLRLNWPVHGAREATMYLGALCCCFSALVTVVQGVPAALGVIGLVLFGHTFLSANMFAAVTDMFSDSQVGRVTGLHGLCGGLSGLLFPLLTGYLVDRFSYAPVFALAALMPLLGVIALFALSKRLTPLATQ